MYATFLSRSEEPFGAAVQARGVEDLIHLDVLRGWRPELVGLDHISLKAFSMMFEVSEAIILSHQVPPVSDLLSKSLIFSNAPVNLKASIAAAPEGPPPTIATLLILPLPASVKEPF